MLQFLKRLFSTSFILRPACAEPSFCAERAVSRARWPRPEKGALAREMEHTAKPKTAREQPLSVQQRIMLTRCEVGDGYEPSARSELSTLYSLMDRGLVLRSESRWLLTKAGRDFLRQIRARARTRQLAGW